MNDIEYTGCGYMAQGQRRKARRFAQALDEWDKFKLELKKRLDNGILTQVQYNKLLTDKAKELDL